MTMAAMFKAMDTARNFQRQSTLPEGRPAHFFKIILPTVIIDKKLRLPVKFVNDYGKDFTSIVTLCDPNCREWQVGLEKSGDDVWFCEGWVRFADFYSITSEFLLIFRYEGHSKFHVLIFDMSGSEIQYPCNDSNCNKRVEEDEESSLKSFENDHDYDCDDADYDNNDKDDDYGVELDDSGDNQAQDNDFIDYESSSPSQSPSHFPQRGRGFTKFIDRTSKWPPKSSSHRKRKRHESNFYESDSQGEDNQTKDDDFVDYESSSPSQSPSHFCLRGRGSTKFIDRASKWPSKSSSQRKRKRHETNVYESDQSGSQGEDIKVASNHQTPKSKKQHFGYGFRFKEVEHTQWRRCAKSRSRHYRVKHISTKEKEKVIRAAQKYKPEFPSFRVELRSQNIYNKFVYVPAKFASKYLDGRPELIKLETLDGKQWPVRCFCRDGSGNGRSIGKGWAKFSNDNDLQEGDVCLFELINARKIVLKVRIFRADEYAGK